MSKRSIFSLPLMLTTLLAVAETAVARDVITVSVNLPSSDFNSIQDAIDAAMDGDTLLINPGSGYVEPSPVIQGKELTLVVDGGSAWGFPDLVIQDIPTEKRVTVTGVRTGIRVLNAAGPILISRSGWTSDGNEAYVESCAAVTFVDCRFHGFSPNDDGEHGQDGMRIVGSNVTLYGTESEGGTAQDVACIGEFPGDGGDGIELQANSVVRAVNCEFTFGLPGFGDCGEVGTFGEDVRVDATSSFSVEAHPETTLTAPSLVREGETYEVEIKGVVGEPVFLISSTDLQYRPLPPSVGVLHPAQPLEATQVGTIPFTGVLTLTFVAPNLGGADESRGQFLQGFVASAGARYLSWPRPLMVVDSSF